MAGLTYREAGVDIEAGDELVQRIKPLAQSTRSEHVLGSLQGMAAIQGFVAERAFVHRFEERNRAWLKTGIQLALIRAVAAANPNIVVVLSNGAPVEMPWADKAQAMNQLKAKLYELEMQKRRSEASALEDSKADVGWGSQIRNYVLDQSRIKDLRTGIENSNCNAVLDGDLDEFIEASLKQGL